jgi:hypothetical protein
MLLFEIRGYYKENTPTKNAGVHCSFTQKKRELKNS